MAHQIHIKSEKYRQWVKAGLGLGYLKEGLAPFCDAVAKQQHNDILDNIKRTKTLPTIVCGICTLQNLKPDHVKLGNKQCPLRHTNCNCCFTAGKNPCPNNICGAIYDSIINYHASTPPAPNWKNTQTQQWTTDHWSVAKCFINAQGYAPKTSAADTDCTGLLHVIVNNKYFHKHVSCNMTIHNNIFSKVRQYRNDIFHSTTMKLDNTKTNSYIDDMIAVLHDGKELIHRQDAQEAVKKLQDLKNEAFIISTEDAEKVLDDIRADLSLIKGTIEGLATKEDIGDLKLKVVTLDTVICELNQEIKRLNDISAQKKTDYETSRADLQEELIKEYREYLLHMPAMPCQPDTEFSFEEVYVTPRITLKSKDKDGKEIETEVKSMSDIFFKDGKPIKSIYILGEAGSGKSSFCKSLVHIWCTAHSAAPDRGGQQAKRQEIGGLNTTDYLDEINEIKNFKFLFFVSLRDYTDKTSIQDMLEGEYKHHVLKDLIERESQTCLIVLDGLDEWSSTLKCPPKRAKFRNYTVLTTSRPWKIGSLGIRDNEMGPNIHINGLAVISKWSMIIKTVKVLNKTFSEDKDPITCIEELKTEAFISLTHTAIMVQQLICLWFDGKLHNASKCSIYTSMVDLLFAWYKKNVPDAPLFNEMLNKSQDVEMPEYLNKTEECKLHSFVIQRVSRLAYETLIKNEKETSLTFDSSMFKKLDISNDIKDCCLKLGILTEEKGPSLSASSSRKLHISFFHKSIQEYLAALHIVLKIKTEQESSLDTKSADLSGYLSKMLRVTTVDELLEQENVLLMLCGLEPRLAKSVSKLIYNTVANDDRVVKYRNTFTITRFELRFSLEDIILMLVKNIQKCILDCIEETKTSNELHQFSFDIGDIAFNSFEYNRLLRGVTENNISLDRVMSLNIDFNLIDKGESYGRLLDCMTKCKNLQAIKAAFGFDGEVNQHICDIIESNASTLKCMSVQSNNYGHHIYMNPSRISPFRRIANMMHLVALKVEGLTVTHEDFISLCTFLSGTGNLQQISINLKCDESKKQHDVDLSKHKQLQYLKYQQPVVVTKADCTNLEVVECCSMTQIQSCIDVLDLLSNAVKLKTITLAYDSSLKFKLFSFEFNDDLNLHATVTRKLISFLSSLSHLRDLTLKGFTFTDNIIRCPSEMKSIRSIDISEGTMSLTTWRKFVDSVAEQPQPVKVRAGPLCLKRDVEENNRGKHGGGAEVDAIQYVKEREALFDVSVDLEMSIDITTKK